MAPGPGDEDDEALPRAEEPEPLQPVAAGFDSVPVAAEQVSEPVPAARIIFDDQDPGVHDSSGPGLHCTAANSGVAWSNPRARRWRRHFRPTGP